MLRTFIACILVTATSLCGAQGVGRLGRIAVVDRETGHAIPLHRYRGEYWIAGIPGTRYGIQVQNELGERLLVVASVDGVNVISGETAAWDQTGYVLRAGEDYQIPGWRKSDTSVAAFTFTSLPDSYAARTGRGANVGVIGMALFREQPPARSVAPAPPISGAPFEFGGLNAPVAAPATSAAASAADSAVVVTGSRVARDSVTSPDPSSKLGTGHGEREYSYVTDTQFVRLQSRPNELIRIHYDSLENLMAMGIIRRPPLPQPPDANPFPGSPMRQYVPDPPG